MEGIIFYLCITSITDSDSTADGTDYNTNNGENEFCAFYNKSFYGCLYNFDYITADRENLPVSYFGC